MERMACAYKKKIIQKKPTAYETEVIEEAYNLFYNDKTLQSILTVNFKNFIRTKTQSLIKMIRNSPYCDKNMPSTDENLHLFMEGFVTTITSYWTPLNKKEVRRYFINMFKEMNVHNIKIKFDFETFEFYKEITIKINNIKKFKNYFSLIIFSNICP